MIAALDAYNVNPDPIVEGWGGEGSFSSDGISFNNLSSSIMDDLDSVLWSLRRDMKRGGMGGRGVRGGRGITIDMKIVWSSKTAWKMDWMKFNWRKYMRK